jgi:hypothetical protein
VEGAVLPAFQKKCSSETYLASLKTGKIDPGRFLKALGAALRNMLSNKSKGFELGGFEKLSANSKAFCAKWLRPL